VEAIENGAKRYGSKVTVQYGKAEFVDDTSGQGTDREQRDRAREIYEANVRESPVARSAEIWAGVRDRWSKTGKAATEKRLIRVSRAILPRCATSLGIAAAIISYLSTAIACSNWSRRPAIWQDYRAEKITQAEAQTCIGKIAPVCNPSWND
jgi:hypothetical protein